MRRMLLGGAALALLALFLGRERAAPVPEALSWPEAVSFLAQHECADPVRLPVEPGCAEPRPATEGRLAYRRIDWSGVQASDAVLATRAGGPVVVQSFDFGDGERRFGRFDEGKGDGADAVRLDRGGVGIYATEDGASGLLHWAGAPCPATAGWLLWDRTPTRDWRARTVRLNGVPARDACPTQWNLAFTRWRMVELALPWRDDDGRSGTHAAEAIVSEHFGGESVERSGHMERFVHARWLGKVRWERWEHRERTSLANLPEAARVLAGSGRCPDGGAMLGSPGRDWVLADCRLWTHYRRGPSHSMPWPRE
ncbi:hypothetical protein [Sabulicella glaciei]|uniref:Uncharacterized protein n=1 Tax=Sabulicella glaciei TaxID=2984948 RepID=A0ABT3NTX8_9PROT|nr:hypothetical protein [Roseococcus sp. MDT2-1-1]MCW8085618.1 hypothetical protein [Roseococcus sp. MDT2-1-1]